MPLRRSGTRYHPAVRLLERDDDLRPRCSRRGSERATAAAAAWSIVDRRAGAGKTTLLQAFADDASTATPVLWGACDPLSTPRPLGPLHDLADQLGDAPASRSRDAAQPHEIFAAVFEHLRAHAVGARRRRPALGRPGHRRPAALPAPPHRHRPGRWWSARCATTRSAPPTRCGRCSATSPARPTRRRCTLRPLSVDAIATLIERPPGRPGAAARSSPAATRSSSPRCSTTTGDDLPASVRDAILARTDRPRRRGLGLLHLLACSPEAIPDHLLARLGIGSRRCARSTRPGSSAAARAASRSATTSAAWRSPAPSRPAARRRSTAGCSTRSRPRAVADPAVLAHHALGAGDRGRILRARHRGRPRRGAVGRAHAGGRVLPDRARPAARREPPADEAELLEPLAEECYLIDRLDDAIAASERAMLLRGRAGDAAGRQRRTTTRCPCTTGTTPTATSAERARRPPPWRCSTADGDRRPSELGPLGHALAMQAYLALQANDLDRAPALLVARPRSSPPAPTTRRSSVRTGLHRRHLRRARAASAEAARRCCRSSRTADEHFDEIYSSGYSNLTYLDVEQRRLRRGAPSCSAQPAADRRARPADLPGLAARLARAGSSS